MEETASMVTVRSIIKQTGFMRLHSGLRRYYFVNFSTNPWSERNDKYRCIFVHVPRTGGTSVASALFGGGLWHPLLEEFYAYDAERAAQYFKFAFVRNPWDRFVSAFHLLKFKDVPQPNRKWADKWLGDIDDIGAFFERLRNPFFRRVVLSWVHFLPQYLYVTYDGRLALDYCGRFEHLEEQFELVSEKLGLDFSLRHLNSSPRGEYRDYYTPATRRLVGDFYERDIATFAYNF